MDTQILPSSEAQGHRPPVYPEGRRVNSLPRGPLHGLKGHESPVTSCKLFEITLLSKNVPANHLVSHSCKNTGLKVPCFHTLIKNIRGEGVGFRPSTVECQLCAAPELLRFYESPVTSHQPFLVSPVASTLTRKLHLKSSRINTYKKQGEGVLCLINLLYVLYLLRSRIHHSPFTMSPALRGERSC